MSETPESYEDLESALLEAAYAEIERLQAILDSRPAINAGLPDTYIAWSQSIYEMEARVASGAKPS